MLGSFFLALAVLWLILIAVGFAVLGKRVIELLKLLREPFMVGFSTASSEAAYPKLMEQLDMARTGTNVLGNVLATAVVAKWESRHVEAGAAALEPLVVASRAAR